ERALASGPQRVVLRAEALDSMSSAGARALLFLRQKLPFEGVDVVIVGAKPEIQEACRLVDTDEQSFQFVDDIKKLKPLRQRAARLGPGGQRLPSRPDFAAALRDSRPFRPWPVPGTVTELQQALQIDGVCGSFAAVL